jgi:hypothetical protein
MPENTTPSPARGRRKGTTRHCRPPPDNATPQDHHPPADMLRATRGTTTETADTRLPKKPSEHAPSRYAGQPAAIPDDAAVEQTVTRSHGQGLRRQRVVGSARDAVHVRKCPRYPRELGEPGRSAGLFLCPVAARAVVTVRQWPSQFCPDLAIFAAFRVRAGRFWAPLYSDRGCSLCREIFSQPSVNRIPDLLRVGTT